MFKQLPASVKIMSDGIGGIVFVSGDEEIKQAIIDDGCSDVINLPKYPFEKGFYLVNMLKWNEKNERGDGLEFVAEFVSCEKLQDPFETIDKQVLHISSLENQINDKENVSDNKFDIRLTVTIEGDDIEVKGYNEVKDDSMIQLLEAYVYGLKLKSSEK